MFLSSHQLQKSQRESFFPSVESPQRSPHLAVKWLDRLCSHTALFKVCHHILPLLHCKWCPGTGFHFLTLCEVSVHVFVHAHVQAINSKGTTVGMFSNLNLLCICCTLLPFLSALTSLCTPGLTGSTKSPFTSSLTLTSES